MKKIIAFLITITMLFSICACKDKTTPENENISSLTISTPSDTDSSSVATDLSSENASTIVSSEATTENSHGSSSDNNNNNSNNSSNNSNSSNSDSGNGNGNGDNDKDRNLNDTTAQPPLLPTSYSPTIIPSRCSHVYNTPTCTSGSFCVLCGELFHTYSDGTKVCSNHFYYKSSACINCGFTKEGSVEFNANFFGTNQEITITEQLTTDETDISIKPCIRFYKLINNDWVPYEIKIDAMEFFALEAEFGGIVESEDGVKHGLWYHMNNSALKSDSSAMVESNFTEPRVILKCKFTVPENGTYKSVITAYPEGTPDNFRFTGRTY